MAIKGELPSTDLSNVFQMLSLNRQRARLYVREQGNPLSHRRLYVQEDRVALDERPPPRPLGPLMVEMGIVQYEDYRLAAERGDRYHIDPVHFLRQIGKVSDEDIRSVEVKVLEESILEVFLWKNVFFHLDEGGVDPACEHLFSVDHLIMEAARRQDEWRHHFDNGNSRPRVFVRTRALGPGEVIADLEPLQSIVLDVVDGIRGSHQMTGVTGLSRYHVDIALSHLHRKGFVAPLTDAKLVETGDQLRESGRPDDAIRLYRCALPADRADAEVHRRLGETYLETGRIAKGAAHLRFRATLLFEQGLYRDVLKVHREILKALPTDFRTLEWAIGILSDLPDIPPEDAPLLDQADALLNLYLETDQAAEALGLAENLRRIRPKDQDLLGVIARLRLKVGKQEEACQAYGQLAAMRSAAGDIRGALEIYRTIIGLAPAQRSQYEAAISALQSRVVQAVERKRAGRLVLVVLFVMGLLGAAVVTYGLLGRWEYGKLPPVDDADIAALKQRITRLEEFSSGWPWTPASGDARAEAVRIKDLCAARENEAAAAAAADLRERRETLKQAQSALAEARGLLALRRTVPAKERAEAAVELARKSGLDNAVLAEAESLAKGLGIRIRSAEELLQQSRDARKTGDRLAIFASASVLAREFREMAEAADLLLPVRITAGPGPVRIRSADGILDGAGHIDFEIAPGETRQFMVTDPLRGEVQVHLRWPPDRYETVVACPTEGTASSCGIPIRAAAPLPDGKVAIIGRNGVVGEWSPGSDTRTWDRDLLTTVQGAQPLEDGRFLSIESTGTVRAYSGGRRETSWAAALEFEPRVWARSGRFIAFTDGVTTVAGVDLETGRVVWQTPLGPGIESLSGGGGFIGCRLARGNVVLLDCGNGKPVDRAQVPPSRLVFPDDTGTWLAWTDDGRLKRIWPAGDAIVWPEGLSAPTTVTTTTAFTALLSGRDLVVLQSSAARVHPLPATGLEFLATSSTDLAIRTEDGVIAIDSLDGKLLAASAQKTVVACALTPSHLVLFSEGGEAKSYALQR